MSGKWRGARSEERGIGVGDEGEGGGVDGAELIERGRSENFASDVIDDAGEAADVAGIVEDARLFFSDVAISQ